MSDQIPSDDDLSQLTGEELIKAKNIAYEVYRRFSEEIYERRAYVRKMNRPRRVSIFGDYDQQDENMFREENWRTLSERDWG